MQLLLSLVFLALALSTGANVYIVKNSVSNWVVASLSAFASIVSAWSVIYCATRFFFDPAKIVLDTFIVHVGMAFPGHPGTDTMVFGNVWLLPCLVPMLAAVLVMRELRKIPKDPPFEGSNSDAHADKEEPTLSV